MILVRVLISAVGLVLLIGGGTLWLNGPYNDDDEPNELDESDRSLD